MARKSASPRLVSGFVVGHNRFAKISEAEGLQLSPEADRMFVEFDRRGLPPEYRTRAIIEKHIRNDLHVVPHQAGWAVRPVGATRPSSVHPTQHEATKHAQDIARRLRFKVIVYGGDGRIHEGSRIGAEPSVTKDRQR